MKWTGIYLLGYVILIGGLLAALWKLGVLNSIGTTWTLIGVVIAIGICIMLAVSSSGSKENIEIDRKGAMPPVRRTGTGGLLQHQAASRSRAETYSGSGCDPRRGQRFHTPYFAAKISLTYKTGLPIVHPTKRKLLSKK